MTTSVAILLHSADLTALVMSAGKCSLSRRLPYATG